MSISPLLSQNIEGKVIDSEDKRPIHGAVISYILEKKHTHTTDANGKFLVPDQSDYTIRIQCLGYETKTIKLSVLKNQAVVILNLSPFALAPVEISANAAQKLVQKAIYNTKNKMILNKYMTYITHILESEYLTNEKREFFFKYTALQKRRRPKDDIILFDFWLVNLRHIEFPPKEPESWIITQDNGLSQFHVHRITNNFDNRYVTILSSDDDSVIKLESYPGSSSGSLLKNVYYINTVDTTLISIQAESIESLIKKRPYILDQTNLSFGLQSKMLKMTSNIDFSHNGDQIYFSGSAYNYIYSYIIKDKEEIGVSYMETQFMGMQDKLDTKKLKRIRNNARRLYNIPDIINL